MTNEQLRLAQALEGFPVHRSYEKVGLVLLGMVLGLAMGALLVWVL